MIGPVVRRAVFGLAPGRRRQLLEVFSYPDGRHHVIDPDMFDIDLADLEALKRIVGDDDGAEAVVSISLSYEQAQALETCVMAAGTYAHRQGERELCRLTDDEFADLDAWVATVRQWFVW